MQQSNACKAGIREFFKETQNSKVCDVLLREIKGVSYEYDGHRNPYLALNDAKTKYYEYNQGGDTTTSYFNTFRALVEVIEHHGGNVGNNKALTDIKIREVYPNQDSTSIGSAELIGYKAISRNKALSIDLSRELIKWGMAN